MPEAWLFALGGLFVLVTLLLPKGIAGLLPNFFDRLFADKTSESKNDSANTTNTTKAEAK